VYKKFNFIFSQFLITCLTFIVTSSLLANDINLSQAELSWLEQHPVITIGPDTEYKPVEFVNDSQHTGMSADYYSLLAKKLNVEFKLASKESWGKTYQAFLKGEIDVLPTVKETPVRKGKGLFTKPYLKLNSVVITSNINRNQNIQLNDLNGKKIAVVEGYFWNDLLPNDYPEVEIVTVPNLATGLQETALGTVDAFLGSFATASNYIDERDITNLHVAGKSPYQIDYGSMIRNDWPELVNILDKAFASITPEEHSKIRNQWISLNYEEPLISARSTKIILGLLGLTGLLALSTLGWSTSLQKQVQEKTKALKSLNESLEFKVFERTEDLRRAHDRLRNRHRSLQDTNIRLEDEAHRDELTGIANRRRLDQFLSESLRIANSMDIVLTVVMIDIDHFKYYNDHYGHLIGDDCLREVAQTLNHYAKRTGELAARFGGEEFTLVLPGMDQEKSMEYAKNVLQAIRDLEIENIKAPRENKILTVSIGIYTHPPNANDVTIETDTILERGDKALYEAKHRGRDQAVHFSELNS